MCASGLPTPLHSTSCSSFFQDLDFISRLILRFWIMDQLLQQTPSSHHCFLTYLVQWFFTRGMRFLQSSQQKPPFQASFLALPGSDSLAALYSRRSDTELLQPQLRVWLSNEKPAFFFSFSRRPTLLQHTHVLSWSIRCYKFHWNTDSTAMFLHEPGESFLAKTPQDGTDGEIGPSPEGVPRFNLEASERTWGGHRHSGLQATDKKRQSPPGQPGTLQKHEILPNLPGFPLSYAQKLNISIAKYSRPRRQSDYSSALTGSHQRLGPLGSLFSKLTAGLEEAWHQHLKLKAAVHFWLKLNVNLTNSLLVCTLSLW